MLTPGSVMVAVRHIRMAQVLDITTVVVAIIILTQIVVEPARI